MLNASQVQSVIGIFLLIKVKHFSLFLEKDKSGCKRGKLTSRCSKNVEKCPEKHLYWSSLSRWKVADILRGILKPYQTLTMEVFGWELLTFFTKSFILDFWQDSEYASDTNSPQHVFSWKFCDSLYINPKKEQILESAYCCYW